MERFVEFLSQHAGHAHWFILPALLLAGCNIPISIDVLVIISAVLATHFIPENTYILYFTLLIGCYFSGWIAYSLGRLLGSKAKNWPLFTSVLSEKRMNSVALFYEKYGPLAFIFGRFIPFGVRNCLFMSSGLSRMPFIRFALLDLVACFIWVTTAFILCYQLGQNFEMLWSHVKIANLFLFGSFSVAVIITIWYKFKKKLSKEKGKTH